jgi:hypothetical protein
MDDLEETITRGTRFTTRYASGRLLFQAVLAILLATFFAAVTAILLYLLGFQLVVVDIFGLSLHFYNSLFPIGSLVTYRA